MKDFNLATEVLGYQSSTDPSNTDKRLLIAGSKNVLIDFQKKVKIRSGYERFGVANTALTAIRNAWTWWTSTGFQAPQRFYDDELEIYLGTVDTYAVNAWTRVSSGWSTTEKLRPASWFDATEGIDLQIMVQGDDNLYEWNGAVAIVSSIASTTITKKGTTTFAQNRFYTTRNKTLVCVRTGTEYTYTGGEGTTTLTGIADTTGLVANDILVQKIVTQADKPNANRNNHTIYNFENQIVVGSEDDEEVYMSANDNYTDFTFSSPRVPGEGALLTLSGTTRAISSLGSDLLIFSGRSTIFRTQFQQLEVGSTLTETLKVKKFDVGEDQGALSQESIIPVGNSLVYLTNEVALRSIDDPNNLSGINPKRLSTPIKPDFDAENWFTTAGVPDVFMNWYKNTLYITANQGSRMYMLNYIENADGKLKRYWNPPQTLPVGAMSVIEKADDNGDIRSRLYGHSNAVPETYLLFEGASDAVYSGMAVADKIPIDAKAVYAYLADKEGRLKTFDEYYVRGEITPNTDDLLMTINYDYEGGTQIIEQTINGNDENILEGNVQINSLAQQSLATNPLGSFLNPPSNARKFRVIKEFAREDFFEINVSFSTNSVDRYWAIISHGPSAELSRRKPINIKY